MKSLNSGTLWLHGLRDHSEHKPKGKEGSLDEAGTVANKEIIFRLHNLLLAHSFLFPGRGKPPAKMHLSEL